MNLVILNFGRFTFKKCYLYSYLILFMCLLFTILSTCPDHSSLVPIPSLKLVSVICGLFCCAALCMKGVNIVFHWPYFTNKDTFLCTVHTWIKERVPVSDVICRTSCMSLHKHTLPIHKSHFPSKIIFLYTERLFIQGSLLELVCLIHLLHSATQF